MNKTCFYISLDQYKTMTWYVKTTAGSIDNFVTDALEWYDPSVHEPFVHDDKVHRVSRMAWVSEDMIKNLEDIGDAHDLTVPKALSVIVWLYISYNHDKLYFSKLTDMPSILDIHVSDEIYSTLVLDNDKLNVSDFGAKALNTYLNSTTHLKHSITDERVRGVRKKRLKIYIKDKTKEQLLAIANQLKVSPQAIMVDAIATALVGEGEDELNPF